VEVPTNPSKARRAPEDGADELLCVLPNCNEVARGVTKSYCERHLLQRLKAKRHRKEWQK
jgi:hypothetical protein